ncbi:putative uracil DNA N-glycosylase [Papiliotrema laurentii]|uniref:Uracil-DNA glycosylase n=1 Tax=Papiliotrema laurentii TaxID=5418 RepID=A0AAD9CWQ1_PAPLA|nr:putative uracil DNA N-glycosylase [Papiliotrema laurentii]
MPPQPARSITSYFNKLPSSPATVPKPTTSTTANGTASASASTASPSSTSPTTGQKRSFLSDAARKAIEDGAAEASAAKKAKTGPALSGKVADVFLKSQGSSSISLPKAKSREELAAALSGMEAGDAELLRMEVDTMGEDWLLALQDELTKPYFLSLKRFVTAEQKTKKVFPPAKDVYQWSTLCPLKDIRVVIIGQDPYHDDGQAHGLAFSVAKGMRIPPSLRNIYKEMSQEYPGFKIPKHGYLGEWVKHGVLLLNTSLTVRAHEAGSHSGKGWETFTAAVLRVVTERLSPSEGEGHVPGAKGVVFMAWGAHAQKMCAGVDKKHLVLSSAHPSPLAASRGFFGNGHFKKANAWLEERYGPQGGIDWESLGEN